MAERVLDRLELRATSALERGLARAHDEDDDLRALRIHDRHALHDGLPRHQRDDAGRLEAHRTYADSRIGRVIVLDTHTRTIPRRRCGGQAFGRGRNAERDCACRLQSFMREVSVLKSEALGEAPCDEVGDDATANEPPLSREQLRSRRKRSVRARTVSMKRMTRRELELGRLLFPPDPDDPPRPRTRAQCATEDGKPVGPRPCPFVSCKHHLYLDVSAKTGAIKLNFPDLEPWELEESCALDAADRGGMPLEEVGRRTNLVRERIRQIEVGAMAKLHAQKEMRELRDLQGLEGAKRKRRLPMIDEVDPVHFSSSELDDDSA